MVHPAPLKPFRTPPSTPEPVGGLRASLRRRLVKASGALMVGLLLAACGQPVTSTLRCDTEAPVTASQRVLVSFHQATAADAPAVIEQLQTLAGVCVRPVSSISPTLHVYMVSGPVDMAVLRARWLSWTAVRDVEPDVLIRRH